MKAVKILSLIAALLMCLSLAACYQQTDVLEGAEEKENVLTADPNYAALPSRKTRRSRNRSLNRKPAAPVPRLQPRINPKHRNRTPLRRIQRIVTLTIRIRISVLPTLKIPVVMTRAQSSRLPSIKRTL